MPIRVIVIANTDPLADACSTCRIDPAWRIWIAHGWVIAGPRTVHSRGALIGRPNTVGSGCRRPSPSRSAVGLSCSTGALPRTAGRASSARTRACSGCAAACSTCAAPTAAASTPATSTLCESGSVGAESERGGDRRDIDPLPHHGSPELNEAVYLEPQRTACARVPSTRGEGSKIWDREGAIRPRGTSAPPPLSLAAMPRHSRSGTPQFPGFHKIFNESKGCLKLGLKHGTPFRG
jgi:hypothetical protein